MRKSADDRKAEVIGAYVTARAALLDAVESLPSSVQDVAFLGEWSAHDLVAHLAGWDHTNFSAAEAVLDGRLPDFYSQYDPDWRTYNASLVRKYKHSSVAVTLEACRASQACLLEFLDGLSPPDITGDHGVRSPRGRRVTIAMLLQAEAADELKHAVQVRSFAADCAAGPAL